MFGEKFVLMGGDDGDGGNSGSDGSSGDDVSFSGWSDYSENVTDQNLASGANDFHDQWEESDNRNQTIASKAGSVVGAMTPIPFGSVIGGFVGKMLAPKTYKFNTGSAPLSARDEQLNRSLFDSDEEYSEFKKQESLGNITSSSGGSVASSAGSAIDRALGFQEEAAEGATQSITQARDLSLGALDPYTQTGGKALDQYSSFIGLNGAEAEADALAGFAGGAEAQFAQQEEEQAILRNATALGDVGGGRVKDELAARASGRFASRLDNRLNQLSSLTGMGQQSAFGESNIFQNTGANLSNLQLSTGENQASAVLGQQIANAAATSEANRIQALKDQQESQQSASNQQALFGLASSIASPIISSFF